MPFLDCANKTQAVNNAADVPYHLLQFESANGDASFENLLIHGDNLKRREGHSMFRLLSCFGN